MAENNNLDIAHINLLRFKDKEKIVEDEVNEEKTKIYSQYEICNLILESKFISRVCGVLFKRELFNEIRFPVNRYFEDLETYNKIVLKSNKIGINKAKLYKYRINTNSTTMNYSTKKCQDFMWATNEMIANITNKYSELQEISNIVKIKNYVEIITMINKNEDEILYYTVRKYIDSNRKIIKKYYKYFNRKDRMKIKIYFLSESLLNVILKAYRNRMR